MAKLTLSDLSSLTNEASAIATINANNQLIEDALENTLSRDGTTPNSLSADLDLNSNDILNVGNIDATSFTVGGDSDPFSSAAASATAAAASATVAQTEAANASASAVAAAASEGNAAISESNAAASASAAEAAAAGIYWKAPVLVASTANLTLSGEQTIDGVLTSASRVLVKDQTAPAENGVYVTAAGAWSRATPLDTWDEHVGAAVIVSEGSTQADSAYICTVDAGGTLGTTAITWAAFGTQVSADETTITKSGSTISIKDDGVTPAKVSGSVNAQTGTTYTLVLGDAFKTVTLSNAAAITVTVPTNASVAFSTGDRIDLVGIGAGLVTVTGDTGVTINGVSAGSGTLSAQYSAASLLKIDTNSWLLIGDHGGVA